MNLGIIDQRKADKSRKYILSHQDDKCYIKCSSCKGTGLDCYYKNESGDYNWTGEFCEKCQGVGFIEYKPQEGMIVCKNCHGCGCKECNDIGVMDWIEAIRYGVINWTD